MAKSQHTFMKRQREIDKRKKASAKREKREEKKNMPAGSGPEVVSYVVNHGIVVGSMGDGEMAARPLPPRPPVAKETEGRKEEEKVEKA